MFAVTGLVIGILFIFQAKSVSEASIVFSRESRLSVFKEMQILKQNNSDLEDQVRQLQDELSSSSSRENAINSLRNDIAKFSILQGVLAVKGPGVRITLDKPMPALWFTDMANDLYSSGADLISINGVRLNEQNAGFDMIPNGQI